ncbi:hypothetical protein HKX48_007906 [Thoreauomyces humboldtii]|nr:hypothetical protein HKX48_007906 [Thoreauomyces humboldtii]
MFARRDIGMFILGFVALVGGFGVSISMIMKDPKCRVSSCLDKPIGSPRNHMVIVCVSIYYAYLLAMVLSLFVIRRNQSLDAWFRQRLSLPGTLFLRKASQRVHLPLSIGEFTFLITATMLLLWEFAYFTHFYFKPAPSRPGSKLAAFFNKFTHSTGHPLNVFIGFVLLPVSRNSPIATFLRIPFDGALRVHRIMGNGMFAWTMVHFLSYIIKLSPKGGSAYSADLFGINSPFEDLGDYMDLFGLLAAISFTIGFLAALPWVRRRHYNLFLFLHIFMLIMIVFAILHSDTNFYYCVPGVILWVADLVLRFFARRRKTEMAIERVTKEETGFLRLDIQTSKFFKFKPGQYVFLNIPSISALEYHPFSIAASTVSSPTSGQLSFLIAPSWRTSEWTSRIESRFVKDASAQLAEAAPIVVEGPFGHCGFDVMSVDVVACFVSGTGVAPAFGVACYIADQIALASESKKKPPKKVLIFWSTRAPHALHSSFLVDLAKRFPEGMLEVHVFDTSSNKEVFEPASEATTNITNITTNNTSESTLMPPTSALDKRQSRRSIKADAAFGEPVVTTQAAARVVPAGMHRRPTRVVVPDTFQKFVVPHLTVSEGSASKPKLGVFICAAEGLRRHIRDSCHAAGKNGVNVQVHEEAFAM